jgi:hypothetical protein
MLRAAIFLSTYSQPAKGSFIHDNDGSSDVKPGSAKVVGIEPTPIYMNFDILHAEETPSQPLHDESALPTDCEAELYHSVKHEGNGNWEFPAPPEFTTGMFNETLFLEKLLAPKVGDVSPVSFQDAENNSQ